MRRSTPLLAALLLAAPVFGQELTLFEAVESQPVDDRPQIGGPIINQNGQPAYTLHSSVQIGDTIKLTLVDRQGKKAVVSWKPGLRAPVPGPGGYTIDDVQQRAVILSQPGNDPCMVAPKQGVSCLAPNRARLALATAAPLAPTAQGPMAPVGIRGQGQAQAGGTATTLPAPQNPFEAAIQAQQAAQAAGGMPVPIPGSAQGVFVNPFNGRNETVDPGNGDQAARDARQRARADRLNNRIQESQVPQGMRRVTTPFGDQLVPAQGR